MERKLNSTLSGAIRPIIGSGVALGLWLVCSSAEHTASDSSLTWGTLAAPSPSGRRVPLSDADGAVSARFERLPQSGGGEQLRGQTRIALPKRRSVVVQEQAKLAPSGRLAHAEVSLVYTNDEDGASAEGDESIAETFDAIVGSISVSRGDGRREERAVSNERPWFYLPIRLPAGTLVSTPVAAEVARRAARVGSSALRVAALENEVSVTVDQFDVRSSDSEWLLLGDDLATFAAGEHGDLLTLHLAALGVELKPHPVEPPAPTHLEEQRAPWTICGTPRCDVRRIYPML